ncbi:hypothetical protein NDU88_001991 [Pleurodeles waltl]|uniref:Uncharacterized protein n=1 Tax=Pleurodeles waltl TaxID=8319 RepID=A0AAV7M9Q8_PLEWA|nr:hypothetical protein NDU88_001991 [Pleurodeles waltl]
MQHPMLLHLGSAAILKLGKSVAEVGPLFTYVSLKQAMSAHFAPLENPDYERFLQRQARQLPDESVDTCYARPKDLASTCTYQMLMMKFELSLFSYFSEKLRENIIQVPGMPMAMGQSKELSKV